MEKVAYITVSYTLICHPEDIELDNSCSEKEMNNGIDEHLDEILKSADMPKDMCPNEIEVDLCGWGV